jgi:hypothetical protein
VRRTLRGDNMSAVLRVQPFFGIFFEFAQAVATAEIISLPLVLVLSGSALWIHSHATDRVDGD